MAYSVEAVCLAQNTRLAFNEYIEQAEATMNDSAASSEGFLWSATNTKIAERIREGKTVAECLSGKRVARVPEGLIHDWIGGTLVPGVSAAKVIAVVQDYDNHKNVYRPEVMESKLISRAGNDFEIYLRLLKKKIVTVVLDTYHDVHYIPLDPKRWCIWSRTTRISEVENAGKPDEKIAPPEVGYGYLWRLNSYWRFLERDEGTYVECRAISLTRAVPKGLGWVVEPMVKKLPKESLVATLQATRGAITGEQVPVLDGPPAAGTDPASQHGCEGKPPS